MKHRLYVVVFTVVVTAFFVGVVASLNAALGPRIRRNQAVAEQRVLMGLLGFEVGDLSDVEVQERFSAAVRRADYPGAVPGRPYRVYARADDAGPAVFPIFGQGFWAPIAGYMAMDPATGEVDGIAFTEQGETPGLGARITKEFFKAPFRQMDLDLDQPGGRPFVEMTPPDTPENGPTEFDAITGATETSRAIERIVNRSVRRFLQIRREQTPESTGPAGPEPLRGGERPEVY